MDARPNGTRNSWRWATEGWPGPSAMRRWSVRCSKATRPAARIPAIRGAPTTEAGRWDTSSGGRLRRSGDSRDGRSRSRRFCGRFTGSQPAHAYFTGCSHGGQEALIEAQRYPADFDGIVAGDPANFWTHHYIGGHLWAALAMEGDGYIPAAKMPAIAEAVNDACDALDGVKDGVLNDPRRCHFDPAKLLCKGGDGPSCLTSAQVDAVRKFWTGVSQCRRRSDLSGPGSRRRSGPRRMGELDHRIEPGKGGHAGLGLPFFKFMVFDDPDWDFRTFKFDAPKASITTSISPTPNSARCSTRPIRISARSRRAAAK